jgi:hypothetical protein
MLLKTSDDPKFREKGLRSAFASHSLSKYSLFRLLWPPISLPTFFLFQVYFELFGRGDSLLGTLLCVEIPTA